MFFESIKSSSPAVETDFLDFSQLNHNKAQGLQTEDFVAKLNAMGKAESSDPSSVEKNAFVFKTLDVKVEGKFQNESTAIKAQDEIVSEEDLEFEIEQFAFLNLIFDQAETPVELKKLEHDFNLISEKVLEKIQNLMDSISAENGEIDPESLLEFKKEFNEIVESFNLVANSLSDNKDSNQGYLAQMELRAALTRLGVEVETLECKSLNPNVSESSDSNLMNLYPTSPRVIEENLEGEASAHLAEPTKENVQTLKTLMLANEAFQQTSKQGAEINSEVFDANSTSELDHEVLKVLNTLGELSMPINVMVKPQKQIEVQPLMAMLRLVDPNQNLNKEVKQEKNTKEFIEIPAVKNASSYFYSPSQETKYENPLSRVNQANQVNQEGRTPSIAQRELSQMPLALRDMIQNENAESNNGTAFVWKKGVRIEVKTEESNSENKSIQIVGKEGLSENGITNSGLNFAANLGVEKGSFQNHAMLNSAADVEKPLDSYLSKEVLRQVDTQLLKMAEKGVREMTLHLQPAHLGRVEIKMEMDKDQLKVHLKVESQEVKQVVEAQMHRLKESLELQNVNLAKTEVQIFAGDKQGNSDSQMFKKGNKKPFSHLNNTGDVSLDEDLIEDSRKYGYNTVEYTA